eukprot:7046964-Lingulodinium_polyedra.AAC.1
MTRAKRQENHLIPASTLSYATATLIDREGEPWLNPALDQITLGIRKRLPQHLRAGWAALDRGRTRGPNRFQTERTAEMVARHGETLVFRPPTVARQSRAAETAAYLDNLNLGQQTLRRAQQPLRPARRCCPAPGAHRAL